VEVLHLHARLVIQQEAQDGQLTAHILARAPDAHQQVGALNFGPGAEEIRLHDVLLAVLALTSERLDRPGRKDLHDLALVGIRLRDCRASRHVRFHGRGRDDTTTCEFLAGSALMSRDQFPAADPLANSQHFRVFWLLSANSQAEPFRI